MAGAALHVNIATVSTGVYFIHLFCAGTYLALGGYVVARNPRSALNLTCAALNLCFAHWSASLAVSHYPGVSRETAALFYSIGCFAWGSFASFAGLFVAAFLRPTLLRSVPFLVALFAPAVLTIYAQWTGRLASSYPRAPWGYTYTLQNSVWAYAYLAYYGLYMLLAVGFMWFSGRFSGNALQRQQARILAGAAVVPLVLSTLTDVVLPCLGSSVIPDMAPDFMLVWALALVFVIAEYRMLELSPAGAADEIVRNMSDALLLVDRAGSIVRANTAAAALLGRDDAALRSMHVAELLSDRRCVGTPWTAHCRGEIALLRGDGSRVEVLFSASPLVSAGQRLGTVCVATDISELKRAELRLREAHQALESKVKARTADLSTTNDALAREVDARRKSEERMRLLLDTMQEGVWVVDARGRTAFVNHRLADMLQFSAAELLDKSPSEFADEVSQQSIERALAREEGAKTSEADWLLRSKDGKRLNTIVQIAPLHEHGRYAGAVLTVLDVTERTRLQNGLAQADRLASLGVLAAGVGHEINNPLTYVLSALHELSDRLASPQATSQDRAPLLEFASEALQGAQRVRDIVRDLRDFTRPKASSFVAMNVNRAIDSAVSIAANEIRFRARLTRDLQELPSVVGSFNRLSQVFLNLLVNAAHSITSGRIEDNEIVLRTRCDDTRVIVEVSDTGHGIAPEILGKLFDPFFTTKDDGQGTGLGLWICHQTIRAHGGSIEVQSQLGRGTTVRVTLPVVGGSSVLTVPHPSTPEPESLPRGRVLAVDDEKMIRRAFERSLGEHYDLVMAESGEQAQQILQKDTAFDVILCDLMMPGMSGMELYAWLTKFDPGLSKRVVFVTGGGVTEQARDLLDHTKNPVVSKPFEPRDIRAAVRRVRQRHLRNARRAG